jgi:uncharacterized iron-regulated membrane protein
LSSGNPIANALVVVVGALAIGAFIVLGVVAFVTLGGILLVLAAVMGIRLWWFERKLPRKARSARRRSQYDPADSTVIEGEFQVVSADRQEDRPD